MNKEIPIVLHTNLEYSFLWKATIPLLQRYASGFTIYWITDSLGDYVLPENFIVRTYEPSTPWSSRIHPVLKEIQQDYVIFLLEDWLLIDHLSPERLYIMTQIMDLTGCKLLMSYACPTWGEYSTVSRAKFQNMEFYQQPRHYFQPALWKKELLEEVLSVPFKLSECETDYCNSITSKEVCMGVHDIDYPGYYSITSPLFPHMHAIVGGKWTFKKYPTLKVLLESFGIDTTTRGIDNTWTLEFQ